MRLSLDFSQGIHRTPNTEYRSASVKIRISQLFTKVKNWDPDASKSRQGGL